MKKTCILMLLCLMIFQQTVKGQELLATETFFATPFDGRTYPFEINMFYEGCSSSTCTLSFGLNSPRPAGGTNTNFQNVSISGANVLVPLSSNFVIDAETYDQGISITFIESNPVVTVSFVTSLSTNNSVNTTNMISTAFRTIFEGTAPSVAPITTVSALDRATIRNDVSEIEEIYVTPGLMVSNENVFNLNPRLFVTDQLAPEPVLEGVEYHVVNNSTAKSTPTTFRIGVPFVSGVGIGTRNPRASLDILEGGLRAIIPSVVAEDCAANTENTIVYEGDNDRLLRCNGTVWEEVVTTPITVPSGAATITGAVGINTDSPTVELDIRGGAKTVLLSSAQTTTITTPSGTPVFKPGVGIGNNNPKVELEVTGSILVTKSSVTAADCNSNTLGVITFDDSLNVFVICKNSSSSEWHEILMQ